MNAAALFLNYADFMPFILRLEAFKDRLGTG